jgi:hypothetical protein
VPEPPETVRIAVPRRVWVILGGAYLGLLVIFGIMITQLEDQRTTVDRQLATAVTQLRATLPLISETRPLVRRQRQDLPASRRLTRRSLVLTREATPLVRDLRAADAGRRLQAVGTLAGELLGADAGRSLVAVRRLATMLLAADIPRATRSLTEAADELNRQHRLRRLFVRSTSVLGEMQARHLVAKVATASEAVPQVLPLLRRSLDLQTQLLALTRETNAHAASLDRKTGGPLPAAAP